MIQLFILSDFLELIQMHRVRILYYQFELKQNRRSVLICYNYILYFEESAYNICYEKQSSNHI